MVKVLLVDDRPDGLITLEAVLGSPEYELYKASSGAEALTMVLEHDFAVIILDVQMPGMDGFETAHFIKRRERSKNIPIIFVTAINKDPFLVHKGYEAGAVDYLFKPFDPRVLRSKVQVFTELYRARRALEEQTTLLARSEESKRIIIENARDIVVTTSMTGLITSLSPSFETMTDWKISEWIDRPLESLMHPADIETFRACFVDIAQGKPVLCESRLAMKSGKYLPVETSAKPLMHEANVTGVIGIVRDVSIRIETERQAKRREELERSNRDLELFASVCSHDLQEPLRVIRTFASFLRAKPETGEDTGNRQALDSIIDGTSRMSSLIRDILTYSKVGGAGLQITEVDTSEILAQAVNNLHNSLSEAGATVTHGPLPKIDANDLQLLQLFQNLISNAIKFRSRRSPQIHIEAVRKEDAWLFSVKDNGIGFDMRHAARIFDVFKRLHRSDEYPGTGVGLGICKKIIERHGGRIWAESTPQEGSTFFFELPPNRPEVTPGTHNA